MSVVYILLGITCLFDYFEKKIPNKIVIVLLMYGLVYGFGKFGIRGSVLYLVKLLVTGSVFYPLFKIGALGAGDVKLFGVSAGFLGYKGILIFIGVSMVIAAGISLVKMWISGLLKERLCVFYDYFIEVLKCGRIMRYPVNKKDSSTYIGLAVPVLLGMLVSGGVFH